MTEKRKVKRLISEELQKKIDTSIRRLKSFEPEEGYYLAFSGGKDSQCIYHLAKIAGVKFDAHYNVTSVDPPELIYFIREHYPDVIWDYPRDGDGKRITMWNLIVKKKIPPTRISRYCCSELKETNGKGRIVVTGVRWAESPRRKANQDVATLYGKPKTTKKMADELNLNYRVNKSGAIIMNDDNDLARRMVEQCYRTRKTLVNPIVDWTEEDVWDFLNDFAGVPHCSLYDEGFKRIGCIGCPLTGADHQKREFKRWPKYKENYLRAFNRMLKERQANGFPCDKWPDAETVMKRWLHAPESNEEET